MSDEFGQADVFGVVAVVCGSVCVGTSMLCCGARVGGDAVLVPFLSLLGAALWSGAFGVVMQGTRVGRGMSWLGLGMAIGAIVLGFAALTFHEVR